MQFEQDRLGIECVATGIEAEGQFKVKTPLGVRLLELPMVPTSGGTNKARICLDRAQHDGDDGDCQ